MSECSTNCLIRGKIKSRISYHIYLQRTRKHIDRSVNMFYNSNMDQDLRVQKGKQTRQKIIDAAFEVMVKEGPNRLSAGKISKAGKVSKASLFHHFDNVDQITFAVFENIFERFSASMHEH